MPIYEYKCQRCSNVFEKLLARTERENGGACPDCGCIKTKRMMSIFAGRTSGGNGDSATSVAGSGGCSSCRATSCAGCRR